MIQYFEDLPYMSYNEIINQYMEYPKAAIMVFDSFDTNSGRLYAIGDSLEISLLKSELLTQLKAGQLHFVDIISFPLYAVMD